MKIQTPKKLYRTLIPVSKQCTCTSEMKSQSSNDLTRDEHLIYHALRRLWHTHTPFPKILEALETVLETILMRVIKREVGNVIGAKVYGLSADEFAELPIAFCQEYLVKYYIPLLSEQMLRTNTHLTEEKMYTEHRLLSLCINCNTDVEVFCKSGIMYSLNKLTDELDKKGAFK